MPFSLWPMVMASVIYFVVLCFWPSRALVFLDKVCTHQTDPDMKQRGIDGLGGFLNHSKQMLLLWDETYFQRLWCTFEVAAFTHIHGETASIQVEPIVRGYLVALGVFLPFWNHLAQYFFLVVTSHGDDFKLAAYVLLGIIYVLFGTVVIHMSRDFARNHRAMQQQIESFTCAQAKCFCCSVEHIMPDTGAEIEHIVKERLHDKIDRHLGPCLITFTDAMYITIVQFWFHCSVYCGTCFDWDSLESRSYISFAACCGLLPLCWTMIFWCSLIARERCARRYCDYGVSLGLLPLWA